MTEYKQTVQKQTDEVYDSLDELNAAAETYIQNLEDYVKLLEKGRELTAQCLEHMKDTDHLAKAYNRVSGELDDDLHPERSRVERSRRQYADAQNANWAAEQVLAQLRCNKPGVVQAPAHFTIDENGNAVQTRGDSPGWSTQFLQKDEEK